MPEALDERRKRQGFIVSRMNEAQLTAINRGIGILVAEQENQLAGFVCLMPADVQPRPPVVDAMLATLATQSFAGRALSEQRVFLYGPVCLDAAWRGKGVLKRLYAAVKAHTSHDYDVGALFIDDDNPHRYRSRARVGHDGAGAFPLWAERLSAGGVRHPLSRFIHRGHAAHRTAA